MLRISARLGAPGWLLLATPLFGQPVPDSFMIFRSGDGVDALRAVLEDPDAWTLLLRTTSRFALWEVDTFEEESPPDEETRVYLHRFRFARASGRSAHGLDVLVRSRRAPTGAFSVELAGSRIVRRRAPPSGRPTLDAPTPLVVLRDVLSRSDVRDRLAALLATWSISRVEVRLESDRQEIWEERPYSVSFTAANEEASEPEILVYQALWDRVGKKLARVTLVRKG